MGRGIGFLIEIFRAPELDGKLLVACVVTSRNESLVAHVRR